MNFKTGMFQIKAMSDGAGSVVFATLNVIDKDGDVTIPGAFGTQKAKISPAHDWSAPSMGLASVREEGDLAIADLKFNLDMTSAQEWHKSLKFNFENQIPQEFSYGFDVLKESFEERDGRQVRVLEKMRVHEVSPVMVGAGVGTRTLAMKSASRLEDQFAQVFEANSELVARLKSLAALREKKGRGLADINKSRCEELRDQFAEIDAAVKALLAGEIEPEAVDLNLLSLEAELLSRHRSTFGG